MAQLNAMPLLFAGALFTIACGSSAKQPKPPETFDTQSGLNRPPTDSTIPLSFSSLAIGGGTALEAYAEFLRLTALHTAGVSCEKVEVLRCTHSEPAQTRFQEAASLHKSQAAFGITAHSTWKGTPTAGETIRIFNSELAIQLHRQCLLR